MSGDVIGATCPAYVWVNVIGITTSWSYCVLKFLAITVYSLHVPGLIPHGGRETLYPQHKQHAAKWMVALTEFRMDLQHNLFSKPAVSIKAGWEIGTHILTFETPAVLQFLTALHIVHNIKPCYISALQCAWYQRFGHKQFCYTLSIQILTFPLEILWWMHSILWWWNLLRSLNNPAT
jgi:hypothetical protein